MAAPLKKVFATCFFYISVVFWGTYGILMIALQLVVSPLKIISKEDHSNLPNSAKESSLGVHCQLVCDTHDHKLTIKYVANGEKGKPLMLCVHGFPECWYSWRHQLKEFSDKYWVVAIDLPGFGGSDKPEDVNFYKISNLVGLFPQIIHGLGYNKATIVAHDGGGVIMWQFISVYPEMCDKVVIMNGPNGRGYIKSLKSFNFKQYCYSWYIFFYQLPWLPEISLALGNLSFVDDLLVSGKMKLTNQNMISEDDIKVYKHYLHTWEARRGFVNFYRANNILSALQSTERGTGGGRGVRSPVLYIWGVEDKALSIDVAKASAGISDLVRLELLQSASHWVQQDQPEQVNKLMRQFLS